MLPASPADGYAWCYNGHNRAGYGPGHGQVRGIMVMRTFVDDAGRIQLPDLVQAQLGVKPGDELAWEEENGRWFLGPARARPIRPEPSIGSRDTPNAAPPRERRPTASSAGTTDHDDLNWEDLDYQPVSLPRAGQVRLRIQPQGQTTAPASRVGRGIAASGIVLNVRSRSELAAGRFAAGMLDSAVPARLCRPSGPNARG